MKKSLLALCLLTSIAMNAQTFSTFDSRTDFRDESIYFVMTTRFFDGDKTNNVHCWDGHNEGDPEWRGDFKGLIEKMDYIKALGFTAIWVTPIVENASGLDYHGYHASDFSKVDHRYESQGVGFKEVVDAAHARGMKIILDIVINHTGNFGEANLCPMFKRDWTKDQSSAEECMVRIPQSEGGVLPNNYESLQPGEQYAARLSKMKNSNDEKGQKKNYDSHNYWHHFANFNWDDPTRWFAQIAGDCVDLNTENPAVSQYLVNCYNQFIQMGVDGFRIDTSGHIARLAFNKNFIPQFTQLGANAFNKRGAAASKFFMFGEVCARYNSDICYRQHDNLSPFYYTWAESKNYAWDSDPSSWDKIVAMEGDECKTHTNHKSAWAQGDDDFGYFKGPQSQNALLNGNTYHTPDYSKASGLNVIDFPMHWTFKSAEGAFNMGRPDQDKYYNDATFNVVYVDSHDYGPDEDTRFDGTEDTWAENMDLMFTYRGIPCIYYGSEVQFQKGKICDKGALEPLINTGRAYFGGYMKGDVTASNFGEYTAQAGTNAEASLSQHLSQHLMRLNKIRQAIPALRKGQYSVTGCNRNGAVAAFKRRYTDSNVDSYVLVAISGNANFTGIENGTYKDAITGDTKTVSNGQLSVSCNGKGNMRVYVLSTAKTPAPGKIGNDTYYLYSSSRGGVTPKKWDGTEMELEDDPTPPGPVTEPCLTTADEMAVFFTKPDDWGKTIKVHIWGGTKGTSWPGLSATSLGNGVYKFTVPAEYGTPKQIIWNSNGSPQTQDLDFKNHYMYNKDGATSTVITKICPLVDAEDVYEDTEQESVNETPADNLYHDLLGRTYEYPVHPGIYMHKGSKYLHFDW